jgi:hypothetical protein
MSGAISKRFGPAELEPVIEFATIIRIVAITGNCADAHEATAPLIPPHWPEVGPRGADHHHDLLWGAAPAMTVMRERIRGQIWPAPSAARSVRGLRVAG